jgi:hypothetical protein
MRFMRFMRWKSHEDLARSGQNFADRAAALDQA